LLVLSATTKGTSKSRVTNCPFNETRLTWDESANYLNYSRIKQTGTNCISYFAICGTKRYREFGENYTHAQRNYEAWSAPMPNPENPYQPSHFIFRKEAVGARCNVLLATDAEHLSSKWKPIGQHTRTRRQYEILNVTINGTNATAVMYNCYLVFYSTQILGN
jgi:hypothetical protein